MIDERISRRGFPLNGCPPLRGRRTTSTRSFSARPSPASMHSVRACDKISDALRRERRAGRCKAARRRRCGDIVEERQPSRCPPAVAPLRAAARRPADCVARSSHTTRYARRSRLASGPGGLQRSASLILSQALTAPENPPESWIG